MRVHRGVFVNHTGALSWLQTAWSAVLATSTFDADGIAQGSALAGRSALRLLDGPGARVDRPGIHVRVEGTRYVRPPAGVTVVRCRHFQQRASTSSGLPCIRYEEALIDVAEELDRWETFSLLANAVGSRRTTAKRLADAAARRPLMRDRRWFAEVVSDIGAGTCSVLERGFLVDVLRPHGLPRPRQQSRAVTPIGVAYRDAVFGSHIVELDGRFHASSERRDADLDRDLVAAAAGMTTVRLGWGQVFKRPCRTAASLSQVLGLAAKPCSPSCAAFRSSGD
ncbi:MAG: hypothetical protein ACTHJM_10970 [Marmoricola sp.]